MSASKTTFRKRAVIGTAAGLTTIIVAGSAVALSSSANAATTTPSSSASPSTSAPKSFSPGGATPVRSDEKSVSTSTYDTLKAAALKALPGGTIIRIETDAGDGTYEAHMYDSSSALKTVKFDSSLAVTKVEDGMGQGDPAPNGGHGGPGGTQPPSGSGTAPSGYAPSNGGLGTFNGA